MNRIFEWDRRLARAEGYVATVVLLSMIGVAAIQAILFNLSQHGQAWASRLLLSVDWADTFLQKGTLWLAFLGASLATHEDKHIAIDAFTKLLSPAAQRWIRVVIGVVTAGVCFVLARVFLDAGVASDGTIPFEYEVLTPDGGRHVCDVAASALGDRARPTVLCAFRAVFGAVRIPVNSGAGVAQLVVPVMFVVIGLRFLLRSATVALDVPTSPEAAEPA